ncbi:MAG: 50S ribosomal protein L3 [Caldivirga sp.]|uniref:50S ribosomal protein L3 n=1 Tax=Caldivirga sp. MU80 TaxID=1650354 RepID=UPI0009FFFEA8|nr:50S ribosomal protein L3 [Caldivirga sp. MU80]
MGLKIHRPRRGSMAYYPRKRARDIVPRIRNWPTVDLGKPTLLGFVGYKVGMVHATIVDDRKTSPFFGKELVEAATVIETPPLYVVGVRAYGVDPIKAEFRSIGEAWFNVPDEVKKYLRRRIPTLPEKFDVDKAIGELNSMVDLIKYVRVIAMTQPYKAGIGKKTPEVLEIPVGGVPAIDEALKYALGLLGKEVKPMDVFKPGQLVDVVGVTKGKGTQGVIKRFGVKELPRWHKHRKGSRRTGTIGPKPAVMFTQPRMGQLGFQRRTEYNKRILKIGDNGAEVTPKGGFKHYGIIKSGYILVEGSVPGVVKRLIALRYPIRPPLNYDIRQVQAPNITWVSTMGISGVS